MNLFSFSSILVFLSGLFFAFYLYLNNPNQKANKAWLFASIPIAFWGLGLYGVTSSKTISNAFLWQYLLDVSAIFIPAFYLYFVATLTNYKKNFIVKFGFLIALILSIFSVTPYFKIGMKTVYGFFWINPGEYYVIFPIYFFIYAVFAIYLFIKAYRNTTESILKSQIRNSLFAALIGYIGGFTNFLPQLFNIYPFGNYFVVLYVFIMGYGVLKYKLLSIKTFSVQIFAGASIILFLFNLLSADSLQDWLVKFIIFIFVCFFCIMLVNSVEKEILLREKLEKANDGQKNLIHIMNHQIKGYLTINKNIFAELLTEDYGKIPNTAKVIIEKGFENTERGVRYVTDILKGASAESGALTFDKKDISIRDIVLNVIENQKTKIEQKGLKLELNITDNGCKIFGDPIHLEEAIRNLIDNSIYYTPSGSIRISLKNSDNRIIFSIKDTGVGIKTEDRDKLFKAGGVGSDSIKINVNSSGYGLAFVKGVIEKHDGKVWFESDGEKRGSEFFIDLPVR